MSAVRDKYSPDQHNMLAPYLNTKHLVNVVCAHIVGYVLRYVGILL